MLFEAKYILFFAMFSPQIICLLHTGYDGMRTKTNENYTIALIFYVKGRLFTFVLLFKFFVQKINFIVFQPTIFAYRIVPDYYYYSLL